MPNVSAIFTHKVLLTKSYHIMIETDSRKIFLDTETTGMNKKGKVYENHRIIEIGGVEVVQGKLTGNNFHVYLNPERLVEMEAFKIHGISDEFLIDKPLF